MELVHHFTTNHSVGCGKTADVLFLKIGWNRLGLFRVRIPRHSHNSTTMNNSENNIRIVSSTLSPEDFKRAEELLKNLSTSAFFILSTNEMWPSLGAISNRRGPFAEPQKPQWRTNIHKQMLQRIARSHMSAAMVREMNADPAYKRFTRSKYQLNEEGD
jgi:hypothetical protein